MEFNINFSTMKEWSDLLIDQDEFADEMADILAVELSIARGEE